MDQSRYFETSVQSVRSTLSSSEEGSRVAVPRRISPNPRQGISACHRETEAGICHRLSKEGPCSRPKRTVVFTVTGYSDFDTGQSAELAHYV
jgi:hypothetical protein